MVARSYLEARMSENDGYKDFGMWKFHLRLNTLCDALFMITFSLILVCVNGTLFFISA